MTVILVAPELFRGAEEVREALRSAPVGSRILLRIEHDAQLALAKAVAQSGLPLQLLLGTDVTEPATPFESARMPEDSTREDANEMALALSDVLLVPAGKLGTIVDRATELEKSIAEPGRPITPVLAGPDFDRRLDPQQGWWNRLLWQCVGRLDALVLECLAFRQQGGDSTKFSRSRQKILDCFLPRAKPEALFVQDEDWKRLAPDRAAVSPSAPIVAAFDNFDRNALFGAALHRDMTWTLHVFAASAVILAIVGAIKQGVFSANPADGHHISGLQIAELAALVIVILHVLILRLSKLQERWQKCRAAAEHLRIARMCLPLMVVPDALRTTDSPAAPNSKDSRVAQSAVEALKRAVRDQGLPQRIDTLDAAAAAQWLGLIVASQETYHRNNFEKLEKAEKRLLRITLIIFIFVLASVLTHFIFHFDGFVSYFENLSILHYLEGVATWSLLVTAGGPAIAAALHGASTRLGIVYRAALSEEAATFLRSSQKELADLPNKMSMLPPERWRVVRRLARTVALTMGSENKSWQTLVRRQHDDVAL